MFPRKKTTFLTLTKHHSLALALSLLLLSLPSSLVFDDDDNTIIGSER